MRRVEGCGGDQIVVGFQAMSSSSPTRLTIRRPDDWHVHLRDGALLQAVVAHTARQFARAIVMPNLKPPITTAAAAAANAVQ